MEVKFVSVTQPFVCTEGDRLLSPEGLIAYCARVSSPHQENPDYEKLLKYCMKHGHWSVFEMCDMTVEIVTSRAIAAQILRHKSFSFQEFSQRYAEVLTYEPCEARRQDTKNRQNSIDDLDEIDQAWFEHSQEAVWENCYAIYKDALDKGIAKECARMILPLNTQTRLYMKGNVRSWIHYLKVRNSPETQLEHQEIAQAILPIFADQFPTIANCLEESHA